jgi:2-methylisocitrate lyase-like PEP mutase family enzyme
MMHSDSNSDARPSLVDRARTLQELHDGGEFIVVPNAWDAASARILAGAGYATIATTSAGVAWAAGYADGQAMPVAEAIAAVARIAAEVAIPVSADLEAGYTEQTGGIDETVARLLEAGGVGINLEDGDPRARGLIDAEAHAAIISGAREAAQQRGVPLFINGRTDVFWRQIGDEQQRVEEAARRLNRYADAGADCLFAPGPITSDQLRALTDRLTKPLNVMLMPGVPDLADLPALGVRRASVGADLLVCALAAVGEAAEALLRGDASALFAAFASPVLGAMARTT